LTQAAWPKKHKNTQHRNKKIAGNAEFVRPKNNGPQKNNENFYTCKMKDKIAPCHMIGLLLTIFNN